MLPLDGSIEAEYEDGYILNETEHNDVSPFNATENILRAIINKDALHKHGKLLRFSLFWKDYRHDVNWKNLPDNARPIRFKHMERKSVGGQWTTEPTIVNLEFGYQFTDQYGKSIKEIKNLQ